MSLLLKKRQQESQRSNGLNDPVKPPTMEKPKTVGDSWQTMTMQMKMPTASHPEAMNHTQPQTTCLKYKQQEEAPIKSILQQAFQQPPSQTKGRKTNKIPTSAPMSYNEIINFQATPMSSDYKLPEGAYYEKHPDFQLDSVTGNPMAFESPTSQLANAPTPKDAIDITQFQQSRCSDANCSNCKNIMAANDKCNKFLEFDFFDNEK